MYYDCEEVEEHLAPLLNARKQVDSHDSDSDGESDVEITSNIDETNLRRRKSDSSFFANFYVKNVIVAPPQIEASLKKFELGNSLEAPGAFITRGGLESSSSSHRIRSFLTT